MEYNNYQWLPSNQGIRTYSKFVLNAPARSVMNNSPLGSLIYQTGCTFSGINDSDFAIQRR